MFPFGVIITNPALWIGAFAVFVPWYIHLLTRRTPRTLKFPSLQFLMSARASQSRLFRLRHLLLLLLRTLMLALMLAAFLKPVLDPRAVANVGKDTSAQAVVVLIDASVSMRYRQPGGSTFARAREVAERLIGDLNPRDRANLILAGSTPEPSFPELSDNRVSLVQDLRRSEAGFARSDFDLALAMAVAQLESLPTHERIIYLVSDFQRSNWAAVNFGKIPEGVRIVFIPVGPDRPENLSLGEVVVDPPSPTLGEAMDVACKVTNHGGKPRTVPLQVHLGGEAHVTKTVTVAPGSTVTESFRFEVTEEGIGEGVVSTPDDGLVEDDRRYFSLSVSDRMEVQVVSDEAARAGTARGVLLAAIDPSSRLVGHYVRGVAIHSGELGPISPDSIPVMMLAGLEPLTTRNVEYLADYVREGGSMVVFLVSAEDAINLVTLGKALGQPLPFEPTGLVTQKSRDGATLASANFNHPLLRKFRETPALSEIRFLRHFSTERTPDVGQVLARFDDRQVAIAEQTVGAGRLLICNFSPHPRHSDLARRTLFVPLVHEMIKTLRPRAGAAIEHVVGATCSATVQGIADGSSLGFTAPDGTGVKAGFDLQGERAAVLFPPTHVPGFYRVYAGVDRVGSVPVNLDARESELDRLNVDQLEALARDSRGQWLAVDGGSLETLTRMKHGRPLWHLLMLAVLVCLAVEQSLWWVWER